MEKQSKIELNVQSEQKGLKLLDALNQKRNFGPTSFQEKSERNKPSIGITNGWLNYFCPETKVSHSIMKVGHLVEATEVVQDRYEQKFVIQATGDEGKVEIEIPDKYDIKEILEKIKKAGAIPPEWLENILKSIEKYEKNIKGLHWKDKKVNEYLEQMEEEIKNIVLSLSYEFVSH